MAQNRQVPPLAALALMAFLRARRENKLAMPTKYKFNKYKYDTVIQFEKKRAQIIQFQNFLQAIADANPAQVRKFLEDFPELAVIARGTITTASGYTYENVSAIELAYLMDDHKLMRGSLLPFIKQLPVELIQEAERQLSNKMVEVEQQRAQFQSYDFSVIIRVIDQDQALGETGKPSDATQQALEKFKKDFKPGHIKHGKSWIKEQLQAACDACLDHFYQDSSGASNVYQARWYLIHVIGYLQTLVEKCFEQECSFGLSKILWEGKQTIRSIEIEPEDYRWAARHNIPLRHTGIIKHDYGSDHDYEELRLPYRGTTDSSYLLGRDFFVDVMSGTAVRSKETVDDNLTTDFLFNMATTALKNLNERKQMVMKDVLDQLRQALVPQRRCQII